MNDFRTRLDKSVKPSTLLYRERAGMVEEVRKFSVERAQLMTETAEERK